MVDSNETKQSSELEKKNQPLRSNYTASGFTKKITYISIYNSLTCNYRTVQPVQLIITK